MYGCQHVAFCGNQHRLFNNSVQKDVPRIHNPTRCRWPWILVKRRTWLIDDLVGFPCVLRVLKDSWEITQGISRQLMSTTLWEKNKSSSKQGAQRSEAQLWEFKKVTLWTSLSDFILRDIPETRIEMFPVKNCCVADFGFCFFASTIRTHCTLWSTTRTGLKIRLMIKL